jgi:hypothetical protein
MAWEMADMVKVLEDLGGFKWGNGQLATKKRGI